MAARWWLDGNGDDDAGEAGGCAATDWKQLVSGYGGSQSTGAGAAGVGVAVASGDGGAVAGPATIGGCKQGVVVAGAAGRRWMASLAAEKRLQSVAAGCYCLNSRSFDKTARRDYCRQSLGARHLSHWSLATS